PSGWRRVSSLRFLRLPGVDDVAGEAAGRKEDHVQTYVFPAGRVFMGHGLNRRGNATEAEFVDREVQLRRGLAPLDLYERNHIAAFADEIDLAQRRLAATVEHTPTLHLKPERRPPFPGPAFTLR